ncbi:MAG: hypothetical protein HQM08_18725 [Candidatus Riflebacteria bacterium]|nr:hypothetical protein [Candidatus Riflebacteria bacterium]
MKTKAFYLTCYLVFSALFFFPFSSNAEEKLLTEKTPAIGEVVALVDSFFGPLEKSNATDSLKILFDILPVGNDTQESIKQDVQILTDKLGYPSSHEFIGYKGLGNCQRYLLVYFLSYHDKMPVAWEFTFYRPKADGKWQMNLFRFNSDEIFEFFGIPKIQFESILHTLTQTPSNK